MAVGRRKDNRNRVLKEGEYQRSSGTYEYKWRDKRGKRHSVSAVTLEELREKEVDVLRDVLDGVHIDKKYLTINDLYSNWLQLKRGIKHTTYANYQCIYDAFVKPDFGKTRIVDLKRSDVRSFYNSLMDNRGLQTSTIKSIHNIVHQVLQLAVDDDYLRYNPSDNALKELITTCNRTSKNRKALTIPEQELFENYLKKQGKYHKWYPIFTVMLWTGMRVGEVLGLRWCDINFDELTINVNHILVYYDTGTEQGYTFTINTPKTKSGTRIIPMIPKVKDAFLIEKEYQAEHGLKSRAVIDGYSDFIFINHLGNVQQRIVLNTALKKIITDCNLEVLSQSHQDDMTILPMFTNHCLRHTFATRLCEAGVNIKAIQDILGHADIEITLQVYTEATSDFKKSEMFHLEDYFAKQISN